ncbi:glycosyltransferase [Terriglobus albidus]|nr:glycosyltransferase [Terriglobus albidus]
MSLTLCGWALRGLLSVASLGTVTSAIYTGMVIVAALKYRRRKKAAERMPADFAPPVSVCKPLHGDEPGLERNLVSFFEQQYPGEWEMIFIARHSNDAGLQLAQQVGQRYPQVNARYLTCGEPKYPNAKMYSLGVLAEAARHETLVTSDADARVVPDYLLRCVQDLKDGTALSSCLYRGTVDEPGIATALDAMGKTVEMCAGVLVATMVEGGTKFSLGVTMILRRDAFDHAGGYEDLGQYHAEDFILGNRLAEQGKRVIMSPHIIDLTVPKTTLVLSFRNQLRWMQSTRRSRPAGHLGTGLTFALPFGVLGLLWGLLAGHPLFGFGFLAAACANRMVQALTMLRILDDPNWARYTLLYPLRDLMGSIIWLCSYLPGEMYYHGGLYELTPDGKLRRRK